MFLIIINFSYVNIKEILILDESSGIGVLIQKLIVSI